MARTSPGCVFATAASLALLRSRLVGLFGGARGVPSRTATLIGRHGVVTHDIDPTVGSAGSYVPTAAAEAQRLRAASAADSETERPRPTPAPAVTPRRTVVFEDDLDVPDFLK